MLHHLSPPFFKLQFQAVSSYQQDSGMKRLLNQLTFFIMPVFNVDGYYFSWTTVQSVYIHNNLIVNTNKTSQ